MATEENSIQSWLKQAEMAVELNDRRGASILINQVLQREFTNEKAWRLLYRLYGTKQTFEVFQIDFAQNNFPDKAYLLTSIPDWMSEVDSDNPQPFYQEKPFQSTVTDQPVTQKPAEPPKSQSQLTKIFLLAIAVFGCLIILIPAICYFSGLWPSFSSGLFPTRPPDFPFATEIIGTSSVESTEMVATIPPLTKQVPPTLEQSPTIETSPSLEPSQTPQVVASLTPFPQLISEPIGFINIYYGYLNARDYPIAFTYLSQGFIDRLGAKQGHPYQYDKDYVGYWVTVKQVEVLEASIESQDELSAVLVAKMRYSLHNGTISVYYHRFSLIRYSNAGPWLIDRTEVWN